MRSLVFDGQLRLDDKTPDPVLQQGQALLKIRTAGICNTDMELIRGYKGFQGILGHEFVADVVDGPPEWLGRRVVGEISVTHGDCEYCRAGIPSQCRHRTTVGINQHPGAFADYLALTTDNLHAVPDTISDDQAVFVEPLAAALQVTELVHVRPKSQVAVIGAGKLGMLVAQVLRLTGADLSVVVRHDYQAELLANWGIRAVHFDEMPQRQAQVVVDCTGVAQGFADSLDLVAPRGTIVLKSTYHGLPQADLTRVAVDEIRVVGNRCGPFDAALRVLNAGLVEVDSMVEARYSLDDSLTAFEHAARKGVMKILLDVAAK